MVNGRPGAHISFSRFKLTCPFLPTMKRADIHDGLGMTADFAKRDALSPGQARDGANGSIDAANINRLIAELLKCRMQSTSRCIRVNPIKRRLGFGVGISPA
jgi:hypothetical protein